MKAKIILFAFAILLFTAIFPQKTQAQEEDAGSSASFHSILVTRGSDNRAQMLKEYLETQDSPLAPYADTFVSQADLYNLDWRFVAAIAGRESTFGKAEPCTNAWGWGIYGTNTYCFGSYDEAIRTISKSLREDYMDKRGAQTVGDIGAMYASSPTWASGVVFFMNDIQQFALQQSLAQPLPISL